MTRRTSAAVYHRIEAEGLLSAKRFEAYAVLYREGPLTGSELNALLRSKSAHKRLSELQERGLVSVIGERRCSLTHENVSLWDVTDSLPAEPAPIVRPSKRQLAKAVEAMRVAFRMGIPMDDDVVAVMRWLSKKTT